AAGRDCADGSRKQICQLLLCNCMANTDEQGRLRRMCQRHLAGGVEHDSAETAVHTPKFSATHHTKLCHRYSQKKIWVKSAFDGSTGGTYAESKEYGFSDDTCGQESNMSRSFLDAIAPSAPARGAYNCMDMGD